MDYLYRELAGSDQGLIVTFGYRLITILLALIGACYYVGSRGDVAAAIHEAEEESEAGLEPAMPGPANEKIYARRCNDGAVTKAISHAVAATLRLSQTDAYPSPIDKKRSSVFLGNRQNANSREFSKFSAAVRSTI